MSVQAKSMLNLQRALRRISRPTLMSSSMLATALTSIPGECDAILINAGVTHPHPKRLGSLCLGGSLMLPLTVMAGMGMAANLGKGVFVKITREPDGFSTRVVSFVAIYRCSSVRDREIEPLLGKAMAAGALFKMKRPTILLTPVSFTAPIRAGAVRRVRIGQAVEL